MRRQPLRGVCNIDRYYSAPTDNVTQLRHVQRASAPVRSCLDNEVWLGFPNDILVAPQVEWELQERHTHPVSISGGLSVVEIVKQNHHWTFDYLHGSKSAHATDYE